MFKTLSKAITYYPRPRRSASILIVDGNDADARQLHESLETEGYNVERVNDAEAAIEWLGARQPDLVILELVLPNASGFHMLRRYRAMNGTAPVLVLSARNHEVDRVQALRSGADDYVTKSTGPLEVLARVEAVLRRVSSERFRQAERVPPIMFGDVAVDLRTRSVTRQGVPVSLTPLEFNLLLYFIQHEGTIVTREDLLHDVWQYSASLASRTVDQHVSQLRIKLEENPAVPVHFITVRKVGYRFER